MKLFWEALGCAALGVVIGVGVIRCTPKDEQIAAKAAIDVCGVVVASADAGVDDILRELLRQIAAYEADERLRGLARDGGTR